MARTLKINTSALLTIAVLAFLLQYPVRTLVADVLFAMTSREIDDPTTAELDVLDISEETLPSYRTAIERIREASLWDPDNSTYAKAQADLYIRLGIWATVIGQVGGNLPKEIMEGSKAQMRAQDLITKAIDLQPSNPDYHLALANVHGDRIDNVDGFNTEKPAGQSYDELEKAVQLYPINSPLRYAVGMQYLIIGDKSKALEHAKALATLDDSYRLPDTIGNNASIERRSSKYLSFLSQSYLTKAFEIAWRASGQDYRVIKAMTPDEQEARNVLQVFMEIKGFDQNAVVQLPSEINNK